MPRERQWPKRQICTLETMSRGAAMLAAKEWSMERGAPMPRPLPPHSSAPSELETGWNRCVGLFADTTETNPILADLALRQNYIDFLARLKIVLDALDVDCRELPYDRMLPLAEFGLEQCGWSQDEILQLINELHQDDCRRCSTRR